MDVRDKFTAQALNQEEMGPSTHRWMGSREFLTLWRRRIACAKHPQFPVLLVASYSLHGLKHSRSSTCHCACHKLCRKSIRVVQRVNKYPHFKEPEVSSPFSQKPATGPYSEPVNIISS